MKYVFLFILLLGVQPIRAQKYALLDMHINRPVTYSNTVTTADKFNGLFPVEKKNLKQFVKALEEIEKKLATEGHLGAATQYAMGCTTFLGLTVPLARGDHLDYLITSTCENVRISMHLCDAKISNTSNAYFIKTWIKYIKNSMKQKAGSKDKRQKTTSNKLHLLS